MRAMPAMRGDYGRADWERVAVKVTALILGTTMQFGYGPVQTLCTARNTPPYVGTHVSFPLN